MNDVSLAFNVLGRDRGATRTIGRVGREIRSVSIIAAAAQIALGAAIASAAAHAIALTSAVIPAVGAIALVPGAAFAAVAGISVFAMAMGGLSDAFKALSATSTGAGGKVAGAERRIAAAQREVLSAQTALNDARREATDRIEDLARTLAGARLDEESAVLAVVEAERDLRDARRSGNRLDISRAELSYRQAQQTVDEVRDRVQDLTTEQADAAQKGVEGSDQVRQALERQTAAVEGLAAAQESLAGGGGVDKLAEAMAKLSPAARDLVTTVKALMPAWSGLRRSVQQTTLAEVAGDVRALSDAWLPMLRVRLNQVAAGWNVAIRSTAGLARSQVFIADTGTMLGHTAVMVERLGRAIAPIISGLRHFGVVGSTFLPGIASSTLSIAQRFERWAAAARTSGRMQEWMSKAAVVLRQLWAIGGNVVGIVRAIFRAGGDGGATLASLESMTARISAFLNSAEGQTKLAAFFTALRGILAGVVTVLPQVIAGIATIVTSGASGIGDTFTVMGTVMGFLAQHADTLATLLPFLAAGFILVKTAQSGANVAAVVSLPLDLMRAISQMRLTAALRANTAALISQAVAQRRSTASTVSGTAAENVGMLTRIRSTASIVAHRIATIATTVATRAWAAGQWLLNAALIANPIGIIILLIVALVAGIIYAYKHSETFRMIVQGAWKRIQFAISAVVGWIVNIAWPFLKGVWDKIVGLAVWLYDTWRTNLDRVVGFVAGLPGRITAVASGMWDGVKNAFRSAINWIIGKWNGLEFRVPSINFLGQTIGGFTLGLPDIPQLATGGNIVRSGMALVGERGPELVHLDRGAQVSPLGDHGGASTLVIDSAGSRLDDLLLELLRKAVRARGGNVQLVLGTG